jgi:uncharacterized OsmC-like protein
MVESTVDIRTLQAPLKASYREDPATALATMTVRSAGSDLANPLRCAISPDVAPEIVWESGAHTGVGGAPGLPCSGDLLLGALAACQEITVRMVAAAMGIELESLEVIATGEFDLRGTLGISRDVPIGLTSMRCDTRVTLAGDTDPERSRRLLENAERYCVVLSTLRNGIDVRSTFVVNSEQ